MLAALVGPVVIAALLALLWRLKVGGGYMALGLQAVLCLSVGFAAAKIRTERIDAPVLEREIRNATVEGRITGLRPGSDGFPRVIIKPSSISRLPADKLPSGLRLSYRGDRALLMPGMTVRFSGGPGFPKGV